MLQDLKITQLRHFVLVAELKGFHAAAKRAHRTQPAISLSIRDLTNKLGEPLFEKCNTRTNKTKLTAFGEQILPKAKELIAHHDRVAQDMALIAEHKIGHLRLAAVPSVASQLLPSLLVRFLGEKPNLHVSFYDDNSLSILKMVEKQQVDFGIAHIFNKDDHPDKTFTHLWEDNIGVVCRKDHPLAKKRSVHWKSLSRCRLINNGTSVSLENSEASSLQRHSQIYVSNMISLIAMLEAGFGVTTLPWLAFPKDSQTLAFVPLSVPKLTRKLGIVQLSNKTLTSATNELIAHIIESAK
ncbi:LysR family transcriptional regulator [Endozoicomonas sp. (ex Bugula neritina AB1)]|nr:LysR family transcriptional regulator [Endozoicomonas sp. (ex Bugula neritina AB1)]